MLVVMIAVSILVGLVATVALLAGGYGVLTAFLFGYVGGGMAGMVAVALVLLALRSKRRCGSDWSDDQQPVHRRTTRKV